MLSVDWLIFSTCQPTQGYFVSNGYGTEFLGCLYMHFGVVFQCFFFFLALSYTTHFQAYQLDPLMRP